MAKVVNIEPTPNPDAMKFVVRGHLLTSGVRSFKDFGSAVGDPLASALFALGDVDSVFYMDGFVTVNKSPKADWSDLIDAVCETVEDYRPAEDEAGESAGLADSSDATFVRVLHVIDTRIRPGLAGDGGGLEIISFEDHVLTIAYHGACGSCPAASTGTKRFIEGLLQDEVDPRIQVVCY